MSIRLAREAGIPLDRHVLRVGDLFPNKRWRVLALMGYMLPDPYSGVPGVEEIRVEGSEAGEEGGQHDDGDQPDLPALRSGHRRRSQP